MEPAFAPTRPLVFVAGALRSGSTLLSLMLARHPSIDCPGEFDYLFDALGEDGGAAAAAGTDQERLDAFLQEHYGFLMQGLEMAPAVSTSARLRAHAARFAVDDKVLALCVHRGFLSAHEIFPEARFIHLLRDPRDCARSAIGMGWAGNVYHGLKPWLRAERSWERLRPRLTEDQFIEVRFEQLVVEPQRELTRVAAFLGLSFDPRMLDLSGSSYAPPSARFADQWRRTMSPRDQGLVCTRAGDLMVRRGYERSGSHASQLAWPAAALLSLHDRMVRHRFRIDRFGPRLYVSELLGRLPGLRDLHRRTVSEMLVIDKRFMQ